MTIALLIWFALKHSGEISVQELVVVPEDATLLHFAKELELGHGDLINSKYFAVKHKKIKAAHYQHLQVLLHSMQLSQINKPVKHLLTAQMINSHVSHTT